MSAGKVKLVKNSRAVGEYLSEDGKYVVFLSGIQKDVSPYSRSNSLQRLWVMFDLRSGAQVARFFRLSDARHWLGSLKGEGR